MVGLLLLVGKVSILVGLVGFCLTRHMAQKMAHTLVLGPNTPRLEYIASC